MQQQKVSALSSPEPFMQAVPARPTLLVEVFGEQYFIDAQTGEILSSSRKLPRHPYTHVIKADVGIDTQFPDEARDPDELAAAIAPYDLWQDKTYISSAKILALLALEVTAPAVRLMDYLGSNLAGRNHWFGRTADLVESTGLPERTVERALKELEDSNLIKRKRQGRAWPLRISIHPWFSWRGDLLLRDAAISDWVIGRVQQQSAT